MVRKLEPFRARTPTRIMNFSDRGKTTDSMETVDAENGANSRGRNRWAGMRGQVWETNHQEAPKSFSWPITDGGGATDQNRTQSARVAPFKDGSGGWYCEERTCVAAVRRKRNL